MNEVDILKRTADVVTDRMIQVEVPIAKRSLIDKILKRPDTRVFDIRRACLGCLINFSGQVLAISGVENLAEMNVAKIISAVASDGNTMVRCLAILIENTENEPSLELVRFIRRNLDLPDMKAVLVHLLNHSRFEDFMSSIILVKGMSLLKPEEMIAPEKIVSGAPLEEQLSTSGLATTTV